ncbi:glycosyltransferase family 2 protein [Sulfitobacter sp. JB4-11]|uniref:glycosyltransferase family 2 protein n=1 Tax=Sulfitobacter rhodophyticola TaxID=3238304 RepID=UPI003D81B85B
MARRITLLIGPVERACARFRMLFAEQAEALERHGITTPDWNHVRLYAACADPEAVSVLRYKRGLDGPLVGETLITEFENKLRREMPELAGDHVVISAAQLGAYLTTPAELKRLHALLAPHFDDIRIALHVQAQARMALDHYAYAVMEGRRTGLEAELALAKGKDWGKSALAQRGENAPYFGLFDDIQHPPPWLDFSALQKLWEGTFGKGKVALHPLDMDRLYGIEGSGILSDVLDVPLDPARPERAPAPEPAAALTRVRQFNDVLIRFMQKREIICPRDVWQQLRMNVRVDAPPIDPGSLHAITTHFANKNKRLIKRFPALADALQGPAKTADYVEADPTMGYRATQYLAAFAFGINRASTPLAERLAEEAETRTAARKFTALLDPEAAEPDEQAGKKQLLTRVKVNHQMVLGTQFRPHNNLGAVDEEQLAAAYTPIKQRPLKKGATGNVIVGCMKNEAPYIVEWVAYHRAMGVDNFLIYTNDCSDGTDEVLGRLQEMGILQHRNNDNWKGNSPQQHALNQSLKEPLIKNADWIIHIDVDEFMNVRTGNGTLEDLFKAVPDATNFAMTWRLFGHNGVTELKDDFVIDQFDACAPAYCPKPHTVWGFKTMFRNIGAYAKISCHRPNKLDPSFRKKVKWVNGSGQDMTRDAVNNGWRSSKKTIGYDLLQLNHYALRSAESFLIKRQRGRALHVDRSIGINYWIRMDWSDFRDITIKRNLPRLRAEYDALMADDTLRAAHDAGFAWHKAKAAELRSQPEFQDLYDQALQVKLNETERVAYALSLDMES